MNYKSILIMTSITVLAVGFSAYITHRILGPRESMPITTKTKVRYIQLSRDNPQLEVAEIQAYDRSDTNIAALYGSVTQSSIHRSDDTNYGPNVVIDGNISGMSERGEVATTKMTDKTPWIEVDLGNTFDIARITVYLRDRDSHPNPNSQWFEKHNKNTKIQLLCPQRTILWSKTIHTWQHIYDFPVNITRS